MFIILTSVITLLWYIIISNDYHVSIRLTVLSGSNIHYKKTWVETFSLNESLGSSPCNGTLKREGSHPVTDSLHLIGGCPPECSELLLDGAQTGVR